MGASLSFETLTAFRSDRHLLSHTGLHEVTAKIATDADGDKYLVLRIWVGSDARSGSQMVPVDSDRWQHIVLNDQLDIVAVAAGKRERDSFEMVKRALAAKGIGMSGGEGSRTKHFDPEFAGKGTQTLKAWLRYWRNPEASQAEPDESGVPREWHIEKIEAELRARGHLHDAPASASNGDIAVPIS